MWLLAKLMVISTTFPVKYFTSLSHAILYYNSRECVLEAEAKAAATLFVTNALVEEELSQCVRAVAEETVNEAWQERLECLEALRIEFEQKQLLKYWKR